MTPANCKNWIFIKYFLTLFVVTLIPIYWHYYGPQNFLWLSDIGLFLTVLSLWMHSSLLMSMAAVGVLAVEIAWNVDFFSKLLFNIHITGLSDYMFLSSNPTYLRGISLFHMVMPVLWIIYLANYGYNKRAICYFSALYWLILPLTYFLTDSQENINWVFWPQTHSYAGISPVIWLIFLSLFFPLCIFLPTHYLYKKIFKSY